MEFKYFWILNTELVWIYIKCVMTKLCFLQEWSQFLSHQHCFALVQIRSLTCVCKGDTFFLNSLLVQGTFLAGREVVPFLPQYLEVVWELVLSQNCEELQSSHRIYSKSHHEAWKSLRTVLHFYCLENGYGNWWC